MEKITLTKREYLGVGYWYEYHNKNGEKKFVPCTEEKYKSPTLASRKTGFTFSRVSFGGNALLDTENGLGALGDYYIKDGKYFVYEVTPAFGNVNEVEYTEEEFNKKYV